MEVSLDSNHSCEYNYDVKTETQCFNVTWKILEFSEAAINQEFYISPFSPDPECQLELYFCKGEHMVSLEVRNIINGNLKSDVIAAILDENGKLLYGERRNVVLNQSRSYLISNTNETLRNKLNNCPNDTVILETKFRIKNSKPWNLGLYDWNSEKELTEDLKKFILEKLPTEVVLVTKDDTISVNKAILSARSPVFKQMFYHPTSERENNTVLIDDLMGSTVRNLVGFLYSGEVDLKIELRYLKELYYAADKYELMGLRNLCAANILPMLTVENFREVLKLAREHSDEHLEKGCMIFVGRNIVPFMETKDWTDLKKSEPDLAIQMFEIYAKGVSTM